MQIGEVHTCLIECFEGWCAADELDELWSVEYGLMEQCYIQKVE